MKDMEQGPLVPYAKVLQPGLQQHVSLMDLVREPDSRASRLVFPLSAQSHKFDLCQAGQVGVFQPANRPYIVASQTRQLDRRRLLRAPAEATGLLQTDLPVVCCRPVCSTGP